MKIKAIVLDMDGTITKFNLDFMDARRRALREIDKVDLRTPDLTEQISLYMILGKLKQKTDPEIYESIRRKVYSILEEMEHRAAAEVMLYPGVLDTLRKLRDSSLKIGLVTNNGRKGTDLTLKRHNLRIFFEVVVTRDDCENMKPAPDPVLKVLDEMRVSSGEAILVGDGVMDIMAAKAAGVPSVAVTTGPFTGGRLLEAEPDFLLASINDLPTLIDSLNSNLPRTPSKSNRTLRQG